MWEGMGHGAWGKTAGRAQLVAVLSSHRASRHVPSASLSHYASLSFVVIGRGLKKGMLLWERLSSRDLN
jgi:hypothetical protein